MYEIAAQYPQFTAAPIRTSRSLTQAARAVTRKVQDSRKTCSRKARRRTSSRGLDGQRSERWLHVALAQDDLVSVKFDVSSYFQGAAHPNSYSDVLNFDLKNGKQLKLSDLFKPGAKFLQAIATYCIGDLKKQAKTKGLLDEEIREGAPRRSRTTTKAGPSPNAVWGSLSTPTRLAHTPPARSSCSCRTRP